MSLGDWLKSLSALDHGILLALYGICIYLSKVTLEMLIEYYDEKKRTQSISYTIQSDTSCITFTGIYI